MRWVQRVAGTHTGGKIKALGDHVACDDPACAAVPVCSTSGSAGSYQSPDGGPCAIPIAGTVDCSLVAGNVNADVNAADYVFNPYSVMATVIEVTISHAPVGDLVVTLQSCNGVLLSANNGGSGSGFSQTVFDSSASQSITEVSPPFTGTFRPENHLSQCDGYELNGLWTLHGDNTSGSATGTIDSWNILFDLGEVNCGDGNDNDGDGYIDCLDSECYAICSP